jgi:hypothetical protein
MWGISVAANDSQSHMAGMGWHVTPGTGSGRLQFLETAAAAAAAAGSSAVRHLCARIGSPCLRRCGHGASIGGGGGGGGGGQLSGASNISRYELPVHGGGAVHWRCNDSQSQ